MPLKLSIMMKQAKPPASWYPYTYCWGGEKDHDGQKIVLGFEKPEDGLVITLAKPSQEASLGMVISKNPS